MTVGHTMQSQCASERSTYVDRDTGAEIVQWTNRPCTNQHLYFTSFSVTLDDRWFVILSERDGNPNLYAIDRRDGAIRRLSDNRNGLLRSYVYPQGGLRGLSKASPCLDEVRNRLYYISDDIVHAVNLDAVDDEETQEICKLPAQWYGAYTHISPDGKTFCVPCTDPRAFVDESKTQWEQLRKVPVRMAEEDLVTRLYFVDVTTGVARVAAEIPFWVTHVQFDPAGTGRLIFNLEGHTDAGKPLPDRIWCLETDGTYHPLAPEEPGEWRSHENWKPDGSGVVYHGMIGKRGFVAVRGWDGGLISQTSIDGISFHHATGAIDGRRLFADRTDGMISLIDPGTEENRVVDLCRHDTSIEIQDAHAHPFSTPRGDSVVFTSNKSGHCQVYEVQVPA